MAFTPINSSQVDAGSPLNESLMSIGVKDNLDDLNTRLNSLGGTSYVFNVTGYLRDIGVQNNKALGRKLDGAIVSNQQNFSNAKLYLEQPGTSGTLEVDVRKHKLKNHAITEIAHQYEGATQSINRAGSSLSTQSITRTTTQISTQSITRPATTQNIQSIFNVPGTNQWRYNFGATTLSSDWEVGDTVYITGCTNAANDGEFIINKVNEDGVGCLVLTNASGVEQTGAAGTVDLQLFSYNQTNPVSSEFNPGEKALFAGHTTGANNGSFTIFEINRAGNNILVKNGTAGATTQGSAAGTVDVLRFSYNQTSAVGTDYAVGETALFSSHSTGGNNGTFLITAVNNGGNNIQVYNENGATQGGAAGTCDSHRWVYALPSDPSSEVSVNDNIYIFGSTNAANDGTFKVVEVKRTGTNNLVVHNEAGVTQAGTTGTVYTTRKLIKFASDLSSHYSANTSDIELKNCNVAIYDGYYTVLEVNRGGGANYNLVIENSTEKTQPGYGGRIELESKSLFTSTPKLTTTSEMDADTSATFEAATVEAGDVLSLYILEVPEGAPYTCTLLLS